MRVIYDEVKNNVITVIKHVGETKCKIKQNKVKKKKKERRGIFVYLVCSLLITTNITL